MLQSGRLILPAVIQRRLPVSLFKQPIEVASVGKAQFVNDGGDAFIGAGEHGPRLFQVDGLPVFENGLAGVLLDDPVQIFSVVVQLGGQFFSGAASVTGFHDVGDLAEQIFLIVRLGVYAVDAEQTGIRHQLQQSGEGALDIKKGAGLQVDDLMQDAVEQRSRLFQDPVGGDDGEAVEIDLVKLQGSVLAVLKKLQYQIGVVGFGGDGGHLIVFGQQFRDKVIPHHKENDLKITGKILGVSYVFIHDTAFAGLVGEDLVLYMVGHTALQDIHDLDAGMPVQRSFFRKIHDLFVQLERTVRVLRELEHIEEAVLFPAGLQQDHERGLYTVL